MDPNYRPPLSPEQDKQALLLKGDAIPAKDTIFINSLPKLHNRKKAKRDPRRKSKQKLAA